MLSPYFKIVLTLLILIIPGILFSQKISSRDIVNTLYEQHMLSFELQNNEKKGKLFIDYITDNDYLYEIALLDRPPVKVIDSEDILRISLTDTTKVKMVFQNSFDKGINDSQDFDEKIILEFSKVIQTEEKQSLTPVYSFQELKNKVFTLQQEKLKEVLN